MSDYIVVDFSIFGSAETPLHMSTDDFNTMLKIMLQFGDMEAIRFAHKFTEMILGDAVKYVRNLKEN